VYSVITTIDQILQNLISKLIVIKFSEILNLLFFWMEPRRIAWRAIGYK
jgi:hypothetical protein